jgi:regulator of protease activity HflC (stomatin/prohibitin superfamily)
MEYSQQLQRWRDKQNTLVVWWTTVEEDAVLSTYPSDFGEKSNWPEYLSRSFNNRIGRSSGARLWVAPPISQHFNRLDPDLDYSDFMQSGGVLMMFGDLHHIHGLPGRATSAYLKPIEIPAEPDPRPLRPVSVAAIPPAPPPPPPEPQYPLTEQAVVEEAPISEEPEVVTPNSKESDTMNFEPTPGYKYSFLEKIKRNPIKPVVAAIIAIILLCTVASSIYTINETERGIVLAGGKMVGVEEPGIHIKLPVFHVVKRVSLQTWTDSFQSLSAYSKDTQPATMRVSVTWTVQPGLVGDMYRTALSLEGVTDRFIRKITPSEVENAFGQFEAATLASDRTSFVMALTKRIRAGVPAFVNVTSVQVEDINFSDAYEATIEEKVRSLVAVDTAKNREQQALADAKAYVAKMQGEADAKKNQMLAESEGITAKGIAEASAIVAKANALKNNPQLIQLIEAERWNGSRATTIFGAATPLVSTDTK